MVWIMLFHKLERMEEWAVPINLIKICHCVFFENNQIDTSKLIILNWLKSGKNLFP